MSTLKKPILLLGRRGHVLCDTLKVLLPELKFAEGRLPRRLDALIKDLIRDLFAQNKSSNWIICDSFEYYWLACLVKFITGKRLAFRLRGDVIAEVSGIQGISASAKLYLTRVYFKFCCHYADEILTVCNYLIDQLDVEHRHKAKTIPLGVDPVSQTPLFNTHQAYIVTNFSFHAKVSELLVYAEALQNLAEKFDFQVQVIGDGKLRCDIENKLNDRGKKFTRIQFKGRISQPFKAIKTPSFFFHFTGLDAAPRVILEAMASGCVVFASKKFGIPELFEHYASGILVETPSEFENLFSKIYNNNDGTASLSSNAQEHIQRFNRHEVVAEHWMPYLK